MTPSESFLRRLRILHARCVRYGIPVCYLAEIDPTTIGHYAQALARWTAAGFPVRSAAEVRECLLICIACENFVPNRPECTADACKLKYGGRCRKCGCNVSTSGMAIINKAKMATEHSPLGKWPGDPKLSVTEGE
jgi:hypothetical protein